MAKQTDFNSFLSNIEPSSTTVTYISSVQTNLRTYLQSHEKYKNIYLGSFLSGSYAKHTSIRPVIGDKKRDVDIIVITSYTSNTCSKDVINELKDVLLEKDTYKSATVQSHSVGIELGGISIDVVPVIEDTEDDSLYFIGDSEAGGWTKTDPKGHKSWSTEVNLENNSEYKPLVKVFKWWRRVNCPSDVKYPKGITLEKIVADNLGDSSLSTEDFLISTMQNIISAYKEDYADVELNPIIDDPSEKIDNNDLLSGYETNDFSSFIFKLSEHAKLFNSDGTGNDVWRKVLGTDFPSDSNTTNSSVIACAESCLMASHRQRPIWPIQRGGAAFISAKVITPTDTAIEYLSNDAPLEKGCSLYFQAFTGIRKPYKVMWQIVNTGVEARKANCLRGNFVQSDEGENGRRETTSYTGTHSVQCFIIKRGICMAKSKEFIINIL